jgi:hypothetical protein
MGVKMTIVMCVTMLVSLTKAQHNYFNTDAEKLLWFGQFNGILDSTATNPALGQINNNQYCVKYRRSKEEIYDNIKLKINGRLGDVKNYATYEGIPPKIKMKVFSTAPVGTMIELQFGKSNEVAYPEGVHSQYQAYTKKQNEWEELEFLFAAIPQGSKVNNNEVDQITILFAPQTQANDVFYFDELRGPEIIKYFK